MSLPSFQKAMTVLVDPWKTIVKIVSDRFHEDYFSNFVILGKYDGIEKVKINAWAIVGLAPGQSGFLECHVTAGKASNKAFWISELRDTLKVLSSSENPALEEIQLLGGTLHARLGIDKHHVVGMVSLHQTTETKQSFAVLWTHPEIERPLVEKIMKYVLNDRLQT